MQRPRKLDALTSLRFFAAAMIVVSHAHSLFGSLGIADAAPLGQGVSFFFVLSGFILAYNYPVLNGHSEIKRFWLARFARVWPTHAVMLVLWTGLIFNFDRQTYFPGIDGLMRLSANLFLIQSWVPLNQWTLSFNGVAWSLSVEFFFYAVFPFLIARWAENWHKLLLLQAGVVVCVIFVVTMLGLPGHDAYPGVGQLGLIYFNPVVRVFEFSIGILVAFIVTRIAAHNVILLRSQWLVLELGVIGGCSFGLLAAADFSGISHVFGSATAYYFTREGLWFLYALLIGVFALSRGPITSLLSVRPMVFLGEISFSLYLCHALVIHYLEPYASRVGAVGGAGYAMFWVALIALSATLYFGVEQPARQMILHATRPGRQKGAIVAPLGSSFARPAVSAVLIISAAVAAVVFRPSLIERLDEAAADRFLTATGVQSIGDGATFDRRYRLLAFRVAPAKDDKVALEFLIQAEQSFPVSDIMAVHFNDESGAMMGSAGDSVLDRATSAVPAGTQWIQKFMTTRAQFERARSFGVAMYRDPTKLFGVEGGATDWDGRRLVLPKLALSTEAIPP